MGNHHSHENPDGGPSRSRSGSRRLSSPRGSVPDAVQPEKPPPPSMVPVEKLAKMLAQRSLKEDGVSGITEKTFNKYVFPSYPELSRRFFRHIRRCAQCSSQSVPTTAFRHQAERILAMLEDDVIRDTYVRMFGCEEEGMVTAEGFLSLLMTCLQLSMDHYPGGARKCPVVLETLGAVVTGCFGSKPTHSAGFVSRWLHENCHRLLMPLHRYCVHVLATLHRTMDSEGVEAGGGGQGEAEGPSEGGGSRLLPLSAGCLLSAAAPQLYCRPVQPVPALDGGSLAMAMWLSRLVSLAPSHWTQLYCSAEHGQSANRFLHHTLAYRGPTVVLLSSGPLVIVLLAPNEWRETHRYWGGPDTAMIQLQPQFSVVEHAAKMLYLNLSIRGYPLGLRAGSDPRTPLLIVSEGFDSLTYQGVQHELDLIEVWGCGDASSLHNQQEVKKWMVKEAERHREVKLSPADWMEHPDRYLLELAGRPQYNTSGS